MALMAAHGEITPMTDAAIFADTQDEPASVYCWLDWLEKQLPFPVHRVTAGSLSQRSLEMHISKSGLRFTKTNVPTYTLGSDGSEGKIRFRSCTRDYKIVPLLRKLRKLAGVKRGQKHVSTASWIGISLDEARRMKPSRDPWVQHRWPLVELRMTPHDVFSPLDPTATEPPAPAISKLVATNTPAVLSSFYTEEFEGEPVSWTSFMTTGDESQVNMSVEDGKLVFRLSPSGDSIPTTYLYNANFTYTHVQVNMTTTSNGNNSNAVILVCRLAESGWYEFDISNSGSYSIYAVDMTGAVQQGYNELSAGNSSSIRAGLSTNLYTAV